MGGCFTTGILALIQILHNYKIKKNLIFAKNFLKILPFNKWQDKVIFALLK